jgi:hypothetical protein
MNKAGLVILMIGLILLGVAGYLFMDERNFLTGAELITGTVKEYNTFPSNDGTEDTYCPVVEFKTSTGLVDTYEMDTCTSPASYAIGDKLDLYYNATEKTVQQKGFRTQYFGFTIALIVGLLFLFDGIGVLIRKKN